MLEEDAPISAIKELLTDVAISDVPTAGLLFSGGCELELAVPHSTTKALLEDEGGSSTLLAPLDVPSAELKAPSCFSATKALFIDAATPAAVPACLRCRICLLASCSESSLLEPEVPLL
jgi:hypothetical protein